MAKITVGNITKQISNNLYVCSQIRSIDVENWYMELFDTLPVYKYEITINRLDEDEDFDIFNKIFKDLVATGDFDVLNYEYNKEKSDNESRNGEYEIYATRFLVVSKTEPVMISCEFENIVVMSHLGVDKIEQVVSKYLDEYNQEDDRPKCYIVVKESDLYLDNFNIDLKNEMDFDLYNDGFEDVHNAIVNSIWKTWNRQEYIYQTSHQ